MIRQPSLFTAVLTCLLMACDAPGPLTDAGGSVAEVDAGRQVPDAGAPASTLSIRAPAAQAVSAAPGGRVTVSLTLHATGPQPAGRQVFLHAVSPQRPTWFEFQRFPVTGPASEAWSGDVTFTATLDVPLTAMGSYQLEAGVAEPTPVSGTRNMRLELADASVREDFGEGVIGYRYVIGTLQVTSVPVMNSDWAQQVIDDMLQPSEQTQALSGTGTAPLLAMYPAVIFGGSFEGTAGRCQGTCDHFAQNVSGAISWTWVWAGANHRSKHARVLARHARGYYLSKSTQRWVQAFDSRPSGVPQAIAAVDGINSGANPDTQQQVDAATTSLRPDGDYKYELWAQGDVGHQAFTDARAWFFSTELSVVNADGVDDRAASEFVVKVGADFLTSEAVWATDAPGSPARYIDTSTGALVARTCGTCFPYKVADGLGGRYRKIPTDGSWITVTAVGLDTPNNLIPPPWGNYTQRNPWAQAPYTLTEAELRVTPPPR